MKADAVAIIKKFDDKVDEIAKRHKITRGAALLKVAQDREMAADWFAYRQAPQIVGAQFTPTPEPERTALSPAFVKMQEKAEKRARKNGTWVATELSKIYADPENADLVQADKAFHVSKASGGGLPDPMEELVRTVQMVLGCSIEHARGLALEIRAKKPSGDALYPRPAA